MKKISAVFLLISAPVFGTWEVAQVNNRTDEIHFNDSVATYSKKNRTHVPMTEHLKNNGNEKIITIQALHSPTVSLKSRGFNGFTVHDQEGQEYTVDCDAQTAFRVQRGRVKDSKIDPSVGKKADPSGNVARVQLKNSDGTVLDSDWKSYSGKKQFAINLSGSQGNYLVDLHEV